MDRSLGFAIAASALLGGVLGAALTAWAVAPNRGESVAAGARTSNPRPSPADAALLGRVAALEQRLRVLELRRDLAGRSVPPASAASAAPDPKAPGGVAIEPPPLIDDPVFEAAVRDIMDRAEEDRAGERQVRRDERRREQVKRWVDQLGPRLALDDTQKTKLSKIAVDYWTNVRTLWEGDGGAPPPRDVRLAQVREARDRADAAIRQTLDPRQAAQYDQLDDELRLGARRFGRAAPP